jgi:GT2 family glycosyltransferase
MSDIAVAVVSYQTKALLRDCLASVVADSPAEVVVVDNASSDGSAAMVRDEFPDVVLRANIDNPGYGAAANQAIAATGAAYVLLLNADTRVESGALAALARYLDDNPGVGLAAPKLLHPDGSPQPSAYPQPTPFNTLVLNTYLLDLVRWVPGLRRRFAFAWHVPPAGPTAWVKGAALAFRRRAFDSVKGFDEAFFLYSEETDLCYRIREAGWDVHFAPAAAVVHVEGASTMQERRRMIVQLFDSLDLFYRRHYPPGYRRRLRWVIAAIMTQRILRDTIRLHRSREEARRARVTDDLRLWRSMLAGALRR